MSHKIWCLDNRSLSFTQTMDVTDVINQRNDVDNSRETTGVDSSCCQEPSVSEKWFNIFPPNTNTSIFFFHPPCFSFEQEGTSKPKNSQSKIKQQFVLSYFIVVVFQLSQRCLQMKKQIRNSCTKKTDYSQCQTWKITTNERRMRVLFQKNSTLWKENIEIEF